ncbi:MAG TPA: tryptophan--tRNA ligase [Candidatus Xenobia bacterium]|nr:tryptophan--tRNA ligase [Candidatus Xenobia bacterium]
MAAKKRVLSGMRPTGRLHIGHLVGALDNWIKLQETYDSFFFVADWHALTTDYADTSAITDSTIQMVTDWLAAGLDPRKATLFLQSHVPEHAELHLLFSMITPLGWLERVPSYKEQREQIRDKDLGTYGFLGYPLLQAADILIYRAHGVPVGEDQVPHVELTREVARRFNLAYGELVPKRHAIAKLKEEDWQRLAENVGLPPEITQQVASGSDKFAVIRDYFRRAPLLLRAYYLSRGLGEYAQIRGILTEPEPLLTETPKLPGLDGRKMSKSYGNTIELADTPDTIRQKVSTMLTDPQRIRRSDPGRPEICPVFGFHKRFSTADVVARVDVECRTAQIGCVDCKKLMADHLIRALGPIRERRRPYEANPSSVWEILVEGSRKASRVARATMRQVRAAMKMTYPWEGHQPRPKSASVTAN